jgi:hypothetical protein
MQTYKSVDARLLTRKGRVATTILLWIAMAVFCLGLNKFAEFRLRDAYIVAQLLFVLVVFISTFRWMTRK